MPLPLAQRIAQRLGQHTVERVQVDPYASLAGLGLPFRCGLLASIRACVHGVALCGTKSFTAVLPCVGLRQPCVWVRVFTLACPPARPPACLPACPALPLRTRLCPHLLQQG